MTDYMYLLSSIGDCAHCKDKASDKDIVQCDTCDKQFHAVCKVEDKSSAICVKSFFPMFRSAKQGFLWRCDICLTKSEENKVASLNEKIEAVSDKVNSLAGSIQTLVNLVTNQEKLDLTDLKQKISGEINTRITEEFVHVKSSLVEEIAGLKTQADTTNLADQLPIPSTVWDRKDKVKEVRASLLIKRNAELGRSVDIEKLEKTAIENGIPVNSVHVTESGDTFINLPDKESSEKLQPLIKETDPSHEIITLKSKLPTIALLGVTNKYTKSDITKMILSQNSVIRGLVEDGSHISVVYTKEPMDESPYHQVVLRVSPNIRRAIANNDNKLHMGKVVHKVVNRFYVRRCNVCQGYGHHQERCPTPHSPICGYCSENTHTSRECPIKSGSTNAFSCHNCKSKNLDHKGHSTFWHNCPSYKEQQKKLERTIDYDYSN